MSSKRVQRRRLGVEAGAIPVKELHRMHIALGMTEAKHTRLPAFTKLALMREVSAATDCSGLRRRCVFCLIMYTFGASRAARVFYDESS
jgi:hypothetical protein